MLGDLRGHLKLLRHNGGDTLFGGQLDEGAHLGAENAQLHRPSKQRVEFRERLHQIDTVLLGVESLVYFKKRDNPPVCPQEGRHGFVVRLSVHCGFEQNCRNDLVSAESRRGHDAHAHLMHELEHLGVAAIGGVRNSILAQGTGSRSAALVKRCDEARLLGDLRHHLFIGHNCLLIATNVFGRALRINRIVLNPRSAGPTKRSAQATLNPVKLTSASPAGFAKRPSFFKSSAWIT
jgi:hypothetical protein